MKICTKCKSEKEKSAFSLLYPAKKDGKLRPDCKECVRKRNKAKDKKSFKERMRQVKEKAVYQAKEYVKNYLATHFCVDCGEKDIEVLDFDHVRGKKVCDVSHLVATGSRLWKIEEEIAKCEVRCANDHRKITAKRRREQKRV